MNCGRWEPLTSLSERAAGGRQQHFVPDSVRRSTFQGPNLTGSSAKTQKESLPDLATPLPLILGSSMPN